MKEQLTIDLEKRVSIEFLEHYYQTDNEIYIKIFKEILKELVDGKVFANEADILKYPINENSSKVDGRFFNPHRSNARSFFEYLKTKQNLLPKKSKIQII